MDGTSTTMLHAEPQVSEEKLREILSVVDDVCKGNFESRINNITVEQGLEKDLCNRVNEMIDRADAYVRESTASLGFIAQNQYFRRISPHGLMGAYGTAANEINSAAEGIEHKMTEFHSIVESIAEASSELNSSAEGLNQSVGDATEKTTAVSASAEQAGANAQTVASAAEELNTSIQEINQQVTRSTDLAQEAVSEAEKTNELVQGLSEASRQIETVVGLINDIASQTNLLALNATIEAARAGEAGRGFAVVASEVKSLAVQTAQATDDIKQQVSEIQTATTTAVDSIGGIGKTIGSLSEFSSSIAAAVEEQGAATQEIARNVEEVSVGVTEVTSNIVDVNGNVEQVNNVSTNVLAVAGSLADQAQKLEEVLTS